MDLIKDEQLWKNLLLKDAVKKIGIDTRHLNVKE